MLIFLFQMNSVVTRPNAFSAYLSANGMDAQVACSISARFDFTKRGHVLRVTEDVLKDIETGFYDDFVLSDDDIAHLRKIRQAYEDEQKKDKPTKRARDMDEDRQETPEIPHSKVRRWLDKIRDLTPEYDTLQGTVRKASPEPEGGMWDSDVQSDWSDSDSNA